MSEPSDILARLGPRNRALPNGYDDVPMLHPEKQDDSDNPNDPKLAMRRPYIMESAGLYRRLEVELNYADLELELIAVNIAALQERQTDLIRVREAAMKAIGSLSESEQPRKETR